jgi:metal-sulfur cluster biosynthetic enzyme
MRYTVDYYINRLQFLSKPTITVVQRLDEQIHTLLDKCTDPNIGVPIVADLSRLE